MGLYYLIYCINITIKLINFFSVMVVQYPFVQMQIISFPSLGRDMIPVNPAQFGLDLSEGEVYGELALALPSLACAPLINHYEVMGKIALVKRGDCMFQVKVRHAQEAGAIGVVVFGKDDFHGLYRLELGLGLVGVRYS